MRFTHARLAHRAFAVRGADPGKRSICSAYIATRLMSRKRNLLCVCAHRVGKKRHFFDSAS
jgi:hypothetical protein